MLAVVGGGSWGTALAIVLARRFELVRLWVYEADLAGRMTASRENDVFLPGFRLPENVTVSADLTGVLDRADIVLGVMPSHHARRLYETMRPRLRPETIVVSATKGIEQNTLLRMSEVILEAASPERLAVISGPTFAREVAKGDPTALVVASASADTAQAVQQAFSGGNFRLYTNADVIGVEVGASLKNVIAIAAGIVQGLGLGNNTLAALVTRGLAEITRLAVAMGGQPLTLSGLAGLGDLVLTCTGDLSRNRKVGIELAAGRSLVEILGSTRMVAEGVESCDAAVALGRRFEVHLPIIQQMHAVLQGTQEPRVGLRALMDRSLKGE